MPKKKSSPLWIGTSNIVVPGNKSTFPKAFQDKSRLNYYSHLFNSLEVNSTFYKLPLASTFEKWSQDVVGDFRFTVKLSKEITHAKALQYDEAAIDLFLKRADAIGDKKGCLLIQFPGKISLDYFNKVERLLELIHQSEYASGWQVVVEFRHPSWYTGEAMELLDEYGASLVLHDHPKAKHDQLNAKAKVAFLRFHGPKGDYRGGYSKAFLQSKMVQIKEWIANGKTVYAYFNNTIGDAFNNAKTLQELWLERK